ncbi:MAG: S8 family serine peptidase [Butyrivibrio sp.]|nr:S8 family serine peptidase [Butyrivibrio sp.]
MKNRQIKRLLSTVLVTAMVFGQGRSVYAAEDTDLIKSAEDASTEASSEDEADEASSALSSIEEEDAASDLSDAEDQENSGKEGTESEDNAATDKSDDDSSESSSECSSEDAADAASSEDSSELEITEELTENLVGMPEGYKLSSFEKEMKADSNAHDVYSNLKGMSEGKDYVKDEVICIAEDRDHAETIAKAYGGKLKDFSYSVATIDLSESELTVKEAFKIGLDEENNLPLVSPNYMTKLDEPESMGIDPEILTGVGESVPTLSTWRSWYYDTLENPDYALNPSVSDYQWFHEAIGTYAAWGITTDCNSVKVAVIDSGVQTSHPDFDGHAESAGYDPHKNGNINMNPHGTHVAGIIGAAMDNSIGGAGVAPGAHIYAICVSADEADEAAEGYMNNDYIARAIFWAAGCDPESHVIEEERRVDIINMSLGGFTYDSVAKQAVDAAYEAGVTIVAATGNASSNFAAYPAAYDHVIGVTATNYNGTGAFFTNSGYGADIAAPGVDIYSTVPTSTYEFMDGTSMACPVVAGACALYMSAMGHVDPDTMERVLKETSTKASSSGLGAGIVNVANMFNKNTTGPIVGVFSKNSSNNYDQIGAAYRGDTVTLTDEVPLESYVWLYPMNYNGAVGANGQTQVVYTTDGTVPKVSNGVVTNGQLFDKTEPNVPLSTILTEEEKYRTTKLTIKAVSVNGMGTVSKVSTLIFTYSPYKSVSDHMETIVEISGAPKTLIAGKSVTLSAKVYPITGSQAVKWAINGGNMSGAKIDKNGKLTTKAGQTGTISINCTAADGDAGATVEIEVVKSRYPVKTMSLDKTKETLIVKSDSVDGNGPDSVKSIALKTLKDTKGNDLLTDGSYADLGLTWTSSNPKVLSVSAGTGTSSNHATMVALMPGTSTVTCMANDGSGKKATCKVTVTSTGKIVKSIKLSDSDNKAVSSASIYVDQTYILDVKQLGADGKQLASVAYVDLAMDKKGIFGDISSTEADPSSDEGEWFSFEGAKKGTVKLTFSSRDGSGKKAVFTLKVMQPVQDVNVTGSSIIPKGSSGTFKASVLPATADNKKVQWYVADSDDNPVEEIKIVNGKVTVPSDFTVSSEYYTVAAKALGSPATIVGAADFRIVDKAKTVTIENGNCSAMLGGSIVLKANADNKAKVTWSVSSKSAKLTAPSYQPATGNNYITLTPVKKGSVKVTATADDGSKKKTTITVTLVQPVTKIAITGQTYIAKGTTSGKYSATVLPKTANNKRTTLRIADNGDGITGITTEDGNRIKVSDACTARSFKLFMDAQDGSGVTAEKIVYIKDAIATQVGINTADILPHEAPLYKITYDKKTENLSSVQLTDTDVPFVKGNPNWEYSVGFGTSIPLNSDITDKAGTTRMNAQVVWSSSNEKVATVSGTGVVSAVGKGSCTITASAEDGSGKKASIKVSVITPTSGVHLTVKNNQAEALGLGKSATVTAKLGELFGKPNVKKFSWDYEIIEKGELLRYDSAENGWVVEEEDYIRELDPEKAAVLKKSKAFFTMSKGKVTANTKKNWSKNLMKYSTGYFSFSSHLEGGVVKRDFFEYEADGESYRVVTSPTIRVTAKALDGTEFVGIQDFRACDATTNISFMVDGRKAKNFTVDDMKEVDLDTKTNVAIITVRSDCGTGFTVTSSNPKVLYANCYYDYDYGTWELVLFPRFNGKKYNRGTAKITLKANDGSGKKATLTVKVK